MPHLSVFKTIPCSRYYWWSSSPSPVPSTSPPPPVPTNELPLPRAESTPTVADELPVANATLHESSPQASVASKEPAAHSDGVTEQVESSASSVTSDVPIDVSKSDFPPPPLEFGDFSALGLTGWGLGGIAVRPFEWIQVSTGWPWFYTIIAGTVFWRLVMLPLALADIRDGAKMRSSKDVRETHEALKVAKMSGDPILLRAAALRYNQARTKAGISFFKMFVRQFAQFPVAIGLFLAVRNMCELPLEQLKYSGVSFLPDLTLAPGTAGCDPYYILPILSVVALNLQLKLSMNDFDPNQPNAPHIKNAIRLIMSPALFYLSTLFTSGLVLSMLTGVFFSVAQTAMLRLPRIRRKLNIRRLPRNPIPPPMVYDTLKFGFKKASELLSKWVVTNKLVPAKTQSKKPVRHKPKSKPSSRR
ncbi:hypothetical protein PILCRDRAFT_2230 [Piloderma croceum F 1598]|uniref:Membrane insertase YidC/Oxa/ALB C-terminal domain-containing protein n=1 Tax=Piloderma croceum (strain F 1598) TaxID=765440 RepID=A0A0C3BTU4_PILCF|nr:hypothetical protein PILCRDRAFT_2230 [Piloderma croceum F 1598]